MKMSFKGGKPEDSSSSQRAEEDVSTTTVMTPLKYASTHKHGLSINASINLLNSTSHINEAGSGKVLNLSKFGIS